MFLSQCSTELRSEKFLLVWGTGNREYFAADSSSAEWSVDGLLLQPIQQEFRNNERNKTIIKTRYKQYLPEDDGLDRRGFLDCMRWAGAGVIWTLQGGVPASRLLGAPSRERVKSTDFCFVQISDSHIGFNKPANPDVNGTLQAAVAKINAMPHTPAFILHTGDLTHLAKPAEFDTMEQILKGCEPEADLLCSRRARRTGDDGKLYLERFGRHTQRKRLVQLRSKGVHFLGLNNVVQLEGMGRLGADQLEWVEEGSGGRDQEHADRCVRSIPLWSVYPEWGWGTQDSAELLTLLKPFGSVTVLNGHIHQMMQKVEGNVDVPLRDVDGVSAAEAR